MPLYILKLTVPPNIPESNPIETKIQIQGEYLEKIEYRFPSGCFETVKVRVMYGNRVISPKGRYKWVDGENEVVEDWVEWELPSIRCTLTIQAYSLAEDFPHTITLRFHVKKYLIRDILEEIRYAMLGALARLRMLTGV